MQVSSPNECKGKVYGRCCRDLMPKSCWTELDLCFAEYPSYDQKTLKTYEKQPDLQDAVHQTHNLCDLLIGTILYQQSLFEVSIKCSYSGRWEIHFCEGRGGLQEDWLWYLQPAKGEREFYLCCPIALTDPKFENFPSLLHWKVELWSLKVREDKRLTFFGSLDSSHIGVHEILKFSLQDSGSAPHFLRVCTVELLWQRRGRRKIRGQAGTLKQFQKRFSKKESQTITTRVVVVEAV